MMSQLVLDEAIKKFNDEQRDAILVDTNCVVTAGAGSGKTSVLTYRFFRLVAMKKAEVDEILTLTFTKAAAAQMYERIYDLFIKYNNDEHMKEQLEKFAFSTISTIDSFCYTVLQSNLRRFGLSPDFMLDNDVSVEIAQVCAYETIQKMKGHSVMKFLSGAYTPETLIDEVFVSLAIQNFYMGDEYPPQEYAIIIEEYFEIKKERTIEVLLEIIHNLFEFEITGKVFSSNEELLHELETLLQNPSDLLNHRGEIASVIKIRKTTAKSDDKEEYNELIEECRELLPILMLLLSSIEQQDIIGDVYEVFSYFHDLYIERKRGAQILTYNDVAHMAHITLMENEELRKSFASSFRYIMVDEFQDTNPLQKEIIYLLATTSKVEKGKRVSADSLVKDKLFFVGDEKQSIYRFRGADVRVFKNLHKEIVASGGRHISLKKNYRSQKHLIQVFNSLFKDVFNNSIEDFEAKFSPLEAVKENLSIQPKASLELIPYQGDDETAVVETEEYVPMGVEKEALYIASAIKEMVEGDEYLIEVDGVVKRPSYKDIAILIRTTSPQMYYEKALRSANIPYILSSVKSLFLEAPLNDLYLILQLSVYKEDELSYASLLRSGFCNIDDDDLIHILHQAREDKELFGDVVLKNSVEQLKYERVKTLFEEVCNLMRSEKVTTLLTHIWYQGGYRNHLLSSPSYRVYLEHFEYILELAFDMVRRGGDLLTFLDFIRPRLGQSEKMGELEILTNNRSGVNIMTIHKSKGLEFPIVIIAHAGGGSRGMKTPDIFYHEYLDKFIPIPRHMIEEGNYKNVVFEIEKHLLEKSDSAELKRLLYVACTRAQFHLLITSYDNNRNMKEKLVGKNFLSMIMFSNTDGTPEETISHYLPYEYVQEVDAISTDPLYRKTILQEAISRENWYQQLELPIKYTLRVQGVTSLDEHVEGDNRDISLYDILPTYKSDEILETYHIYNIFGTWTHAAFEYAIAHLDTPFVYVKERITKDVISSLIPREIASLSVLDSEKSTMAEDIVSMVSLFFSSAFYGSLITPQLKKMESEVPFIARVSHKGEAIAVHGIIDLLLEYETYLLIIDFKTDKIIDPSLHKTQLDIYKRAISNMYQKEVKAVLCYVREEDSVRWL